MKDFFEKPPEHSLAVGDLVTCTCHGGIAVVVQLYDHDEERQVIDPPPPMNMAKIWWIVLPHDRIERQWMHTIGRLNKYGDHWPE